MNCNVIRDLLPLYTDGLTSSQTNQLIEEHIPSCPDCRAVLEHQLSPMESAPPANGCDYMKALCKQKRRNRIRTICVCLLVPFLILLIWWIHMETHFTVISPKIDSTNPAFILKKEPRTALTEEEIELAQTLFALPIIRESFPSTGHVLLSPSQLEGILTVPENASVADIVLLSDYVILDYQQDGTRIMLEYIDADHTGNVDLIRKTVSTPEKNGKVKYVYTAIYHAATKEAEYKRWTSYHKWFGFLEVT